MTTPADPTPPHDLADAVAHLVLAARHYAASDADPRRLEALWAAWRALADQKSTATPEASGAVLASYRPSREVMVHAALAVDVDSAALPARGTVLAAGCDDAASLRTCPPAFGRFLVPWGPSAARA